MSKVDELRAALQEVRDYDVAETYAENEDLRKDADAIIRAAAAVCEEVESDADSYAQSCTAEKCASLILSVLDEPKP